MYEPTAAEISALMRAAGTLESGEVLTVRQTAFDAKTPLSRLSLLDLSYHPGSRGLCPPQCLLKVVDAQPFALGEGEVRFYELLRDPVFRRPDALVRCYGAQADADQGRSLLLLEYRAGSLPPPEWPVPPAFDQCKRMVEALAKVHGCWWGRSDALALAASRPLPQQNPVRLAQCAVRLFDQLGDALSTNRRRLLERVVAQYPALHSARLGESRRHTLVHGDAHHWNFLVPEQAAAPVALVDWQLWGIDFGAADLAYQMALHWFPERRARFERDLVRRYVAALNEREIDIDGATLWEDYRFMVAGLLNRVLIYASVIPASIWWPHLERAFLAFDDLDCGVWLD